MLKNFVRQYANLNVGYDYIKNYRDHIKQM